MSLIKNISIALTADTRSFTSDILRAVSALDAIAESSDRAKGAMSGVSTSGGGGVGGESGGGGAGGSAIAAIVGSLSPLARIGTQITGQLNAVGGTITTLARRIDNAMKFPAAEKALTAIQSKLRDGIAKASGAAQGSLSRVQVALLKLGPAADKSISVLLGFNKVKSILNSMGDVAGKSLGQLSRTSFDKPASSAGVLAGQFRTVAPSLERATTAAKGFGVQIALAFGLVGLAYKAATAIKDFFAGGIKGAVDLNETLSKTKQVFGESTGEVTKQADAMARAFGLPKGAILDAASSIGLIAEGAGKSKAEAAGLANTMTRLAADASSFYNVPLETALEKIRSGLVGEAEPLRAFGVLLSEDAVAAQAAAMGLSKVKGKLDETSKVAARAALIQKGLATASGDLARTQGDAANQFRKAGGGLQNFATSLGTIFLPAIGSGIGAVNELLASMIETFEANRGLVEGWAASVKAAIDTVGVVVRNLPEFWEITKLSIQEKILNIIAYVEVIPANLALVAAYVAGNWREIVVDAVTYVGTVFQNLGTNILNLYESVQRFLAGEGFAFNWTPLLEGFKATAAKLPELLRPELVSMQAEIDAASGRIAAKEAARAQQIQAGAGAKLAGAAAGAKPDVEKYHATAALDLGSKEALSAVAKFRNTAGDDKPAKTTASNTTRIAHSLDELLRIASGGKSDAALAIAQL